MTIYKSNASATIKRLDNLTSEIRKSLSHANDLKFITFHDAYQYFEKRFHVLSSGTLTVSPEVMPGAERLRESGATPPIVQPWLRSNSASLAASRSAHRSHDMLGSRARSSAR